MYEANKRQFITDTKSYFILQKKHSKDKVSLIYMDFCYWKYSFFSFPLFPVEIH